MRKWKLLESKNRTYCNGRCLTGQNVGVFLFALFLIVVTSGLFFGFDCPFLTINVSPLVPAFAAILFVMTLCSIFRTACSDPGILPRGNSSETFYLEKFDSSSSPQSIALAGRVLEIQMHTGDIIKLKYCATCRIFRPPRVSHCSLCDACIANFDHHCPWVGNCVGLRNYRYFYLFLCSLSMLCIYIFVFNIVHLVLRSQSKATFADAIRETPATLVEAIICFFSLWSVIGLWGYHSYLICRGITTNEDIKDTWNSSRRGNSRENPFSHGNGCSNCAWALCGPLPPSFLDLRGFIRNEESRARTTNNNHHLADFPGEVSPHKNRIWDSASNNQPRDYV